MHTITLGDLLYVFATVVKIPPDELNLRPQILDCPHLAGVRAVRHGHNRAHVEQARSVGDALPMVSRGGSYHPACLRVRVKVRHEVDAAAHFESADRLVILVLHPDFGSDLITKARVMIERGGAQIRGNRLASEQNVGECWKVHGECPFGIL